MNELQQRFIRARRQAIALNYQHLNDKQREAVLSTEGPLLLLAGAGSGKTTVLINRVANLLRYGRGSDTEEIPMPISEDEVEFLEQYAQHSDPEQEALAQYLCAVEPARPWEVLAITFTNKAAKEMKERIAALVGDQANDAWISTFHSTCAKILRRDIEKLGGYTRSFVIYDDDDQGAVLKEILKRQNIDDKLLPIRELKAKISDAKNKLMGPDEWFDHSDRDFRCQQIHTVFVEYEARLKTLNALDFDDLLVKTLELLADHPPVLDVYRKRFQYVMVDEYQDTNEVQNAIFRAVSREGGTRRNLWRWCFCKCGGKFCRASSTDWYYSGGCNRQ